MHGLYSSSPFDGFCRDIRMVANLWLRPANSHSANNALAFLDDSLEKLANLDQWSMHYLIGKSGMKIM